MKKSEYDALAYEYYEKKIKFKQIQKRIDELKKKFNEISTSIFDLKEIDEIEISSKDLVVKKMQRVKIIFDAVKLEKRLDKTISKLIISRKIEITEVDEFLSYMKTTNANPKIIKSFINVIKEVDVDEIKNLESLGKINEEDLEGCYSITFSDPTYSINKKKE